MARTIRVYPDSGIWVVKKDDAAKASAIRNTKAEAIDVARGIARNQGLTIIIHRHDGRIERTLRPNENRGTGGGTGNNGGGGGGGCFITTACVKYYGLEDDCYQLVTLRKFRDNYLLSTPHGAEYISQYYFLAPKIVQQLELDKDKEILFESIFFKINLACRAIEHGQLRKAINIYKDTVITLAVKYKIIIDGC